MSRPADPNAGDALVAAACAEFVKKGLRGARIEDITAACSLSKGAFYLHFASKEALFDERVQAFAEAMDALHGSRLRGLEEATARSGPLTSEDVARRSPRYERHLALEAEFDLQALEMMWQHRQTMDVLIRGCAGTSFEGLVWTFVEREVARVADDFRQMQLTGAGRPDVEPELVAEVVVGAYFLVGKRLSGLEDKPALEAWASTLQRLIHEGSHAKGARTASRGRSAMARGKPRVRRTKRRSTP
jgi:AcrR family transcriptional regulator